MAFLRDAWKQQPPLEIISETIEAVLYPTVAKKKSVFKIYYLYIELDWLIFYVTGKG